MKAFSLRVIALASLPAFGACADTGTTTQEPQGLKIAVAPLDLEGITDACYNILVENGAGTTVGEDFTQTALSVVGGNNDVVALIAAEGEVCSSDYGNGDGGDITYIAPCDASSDSDRTTGTVENPDVENSVTIWPFIKDGTGVIDEATWENPCDTTPGGGVEGCQLHFDCNANSDTLVEFNFTIMRDAQQGFFDVAVDFNDIFCSAKLDSCYTDGAGNCTDDIDLLHGDQTSEGRQHTVVSAFACTAGEGKDSDLLIQSPTVTCDDGFSFTLDLNVDGNDDVSTTVADVTKTLRYAVYRGSEDLECGVGVTCGKEYLNFAINMGDLADQSLTNCVLTPYLATAVERGESPDFGASFASYPYVQYSGHTTNLVLLNGTGVTQSFAHPLNGTNSQVKTVYIETAPSGAFTRYQGDGT